MTLTIKCEICGKPFTPKRLTAKYCSDECRAVARKRKYDKDPEKRRKYYRDYYRKNATKIRAYANKYYHEKTKNKK